MRKKFVFLSFILLIFTNVFASYDLEQQLHVEHWMKTLEKHPFVLVRINAAKFLGELQDRIAVPSLVRALEDADNDVVFAAIQSLGLLGDPTAVKPLFEVSVKHEGTLLAKEAQRSIEKIQSYLDFKKKQRDANLDTKQPTTSEQ